MNPPRKIIHIDCDCFYASVEMRDNPALRDVPLAIGGAADRRGVIATCNYPARAFGIHSAMPTSRALRLCPSLVLLPPDFERYRAASRAVHRVFRDYTTLIEPLSLDEAYLDVTGSTTCHGSATLIAREIRARIEAEVGITASAGVAGNKLIAKIASDWHKPNGQMVVTPDDVAAFIRPLPVGKLWGVGKVTAQRLQQLGLHTCADLQAWSLEALATRFGKLGRSLYHQCRGQDNRPVDGDGRRKSLSVEHTYPHDLPTLDDCLAQLPRLLADFEQRLTKTDPDEPPHKAFVKIKYHDFTQTTMECVCAQPGAAVFERLLREAWPRGTRPVRLLGIGVRFADAPPLTDPTLPLWQGDDPAA
ncbi:DNA polymerase IV [Chitiniphilus eburneus]|uniref:DNA polymerase IV n=1 Tax=Chitiniphilus eburneus TaxID=2571148 RepID=A0A4U0PY00_9NEIS|nr:DNA polymerase IV [Chitiniphilus eburneus]TJZ73481.1 DNA polymerase IV [Chitiniphilus eburneus]